MRELSHSVDEEHLPGQTADAFQPSANFQFAATRENQATHQPEVSWPTVKTCRLTGSVTVALN